MRTKTGILSILEGLVQTGFTAANKAADVGDAILSTVSGSSAAAMAKNLLASLQNGGSSAHEPMTLIREAEQKFLKATGISVNFKSSDSLSISAFGLGLNSAVSNEITLEAAAPGKNHDAVAGARASLDFSLSVSGLFNNINLSFPVQASLGLPEDFIRTIRSMSFATAAPARPRS